MISKEKHYLQNCCLPAQNAKRNKPYICLYGFVVEILTAWIALKLPAFETANLAFSQNMLICTCVCT